MTREEYIKKIAQRLHQNQQENMRKASAQGATVFNLRPSKCESFDLKVRQGSIKEDCVTIDQEGKVLIDFGSIEYSKLPPAWKEYYTEAATAALYLVLAREKNVELMAKIIHKKWLDCNEWARGTALGASYKELPEYQKQINREHIKVVCDIIRESRKEQQSQM